MKNLLLFLLLLTAACGGSDGGAPSTPPIFHAPDNTPHDYTAVFGALTNTNQHHLGTLHQICNLGFAGTRDESVPFDLIDPQLTAGIGCAAAANYDMTATNTGAYELYLNISIDGVWQPQLVLQPGESYNFKRGY